MSCATRSLVEERLAKRAESLPRASWFSSQALGLSLASVISPGLAPRPKRFAAIAPSSDIETSLCRGMRQGPMIRFCGGQDEWELNECGARVSQCAAQCTICSMNYQ